MIDIIMDASRYLMIFIYVIFTLAVFYSVMIDNKDGRDFAEGIQLLCIFAVQFIGNFVIALNIAFGKTLVFYLVQVILLVTYYVATSEIYGDIPKVIFNIICMLYTSGVIMISRLETTLAYRQLFMIFVAMIISFIIPWLIKYVNGGNFFSVLCGIAGVAGLLMVLIFGDSERGARLSLTLGSFSVQISEFAKISFVIMCAGLLKDKEDKKNIITCTVFAALHVIVLVLSRDLGAALLIGAIYLLMVFIATYNYSVLVLGALGVGVCGFLAYHIFGHVHTRIDVWINPWKDVLGDGWQVLQSLFAIGTGGWTGIGLTAGSPGSIPIVKTDFIFSAISEEMGGIVAVCIILLYLALIMKIMFQAVLQKSEFVKLVVSGFACIIGVQTILNIGGVIKFIPSTGITLPLISYGGSSILSMFIIIGFIQGYSYNKQIRKNSHRNR